MLIGIISDIHGHLPDSAKDALAGCDAIMCAGDVENRRVLLELQAIATTVAVEGNCDVYANLPSDVHFKASPKFDGVRFFMVHRPQDIGTPPDDVQVIVHGHTHTTRDEVIGGKRYINPGSCTRPRGDKGRTCVILRTDNGTVADVKFVTL